MPQYKRASTVLNKAADLIEAEGWVRGAMECRNGKRCAVGAVAAITGDLAADDQYDPTEKYKKSEVVQTKDLRSEPSPVFQESIRYLAQQFKARFPDPYTYINAGRTAWDRVEYAVSVVTLKNDSREANRRTVVSLLRKAAENAKAEKN